MWNMKEAEQLISTVPRRMIRVNDLRKERYRWKILKTSKHVRPLGEVFRKSNEMPKDGC